MEDDSLAPPEEVSAVTTAPPHAPFIGQPVGRLHAYVAQVPRYSVQAQQEGRMWHVPTPLDDGAEGARKWVRVQVDEATYEAALQADAADAAVAATTTAADGDDAVEEVVGPIDDEVEEKAQ